MSPKFSVNIDNDLRHTGQSPAVLGKILCKVGGAGLWLPPGTAMTLQRSWLRVTQPQEVPRSSAGWLSQQLSGKILRLRLQLHGGHEV